MQKTVEYQERLAFILKSLPQLQKQSKFTKDRIVRSLKYHKYPSGHALFKEGEFIKHGFAIKSGEVELYSRRNLRLISHINKLKEEKQMDQD
jgi:CRP-like cAMP-binding protein